MGPDAQPLTDQVVKAAVRLDQWFDHNGWAGWDPFDIKENPLYLKCTAGALGRVPGAFVRRAESYSPVAVRRMFGVKRRVNAKAMGLLTAAYTDLFAATGQEPYLAKARQCAQWLLQNTSPDYQGHCWGYPFNWQSKVLIPRGTPSSVVTSVVGDGFWRLYKCTGEERYLEVCRRITDFFLSHLRLTYESDDAVCYSYTPIDDFQVHNANLYVAEFLTRVGTETDDEPLVEQGMKAARFALMEQNPDGSLCYWGKSQEERYSPGGRCWVDHFHSGFEIRLLYGLWQNTSDESFRQAYQAYYDFYRANLYLDGGIPKYTPDSQYPVDIHACAEAILCNATLLPDHPEALLLLESVFHWTLENMEYRPGRYAYQIVQKGPLVKRVPVPFIRWGQGWMLKALGHAVLQLTSSAQQIQHGAAVPPARGTDPQ